MSDKPSKKDRRIALLEAEVDRLQMMIDPDVSFRDMETHIKDGRIDIKAVLGTDGPSPAIKWLAAIMLHAALGEGAHEGEPPNYTTAEFAFKPANGCDKVRASIEVIKPGGKSSHEIRRDLEAQLAARSSKSGDAA